MIDLPSIAQAILIGICIRWIGSVDGRLDDVRETITIGVDALTEIEAVPPAFSSNASSNEIPD